MDRIVRELLATVPGPLEAVEEKTALIAARNSQEAGSLPDEIATKPALLDLEPAISVIAERAQALTAASGSAIGLRWNDEVVCSARAGRTAPDLGVRLQVQQGLSGQCVHSGEVIRCDDAEKHPHVDRTSCRRLGVRSILVAPLQHFRKTLGIFEVLSSEPYAFNDAAVANLQMLTGFMVAAIARAAGLQRSKERRR
jgi:GAF domain-containing protein